MGRLITQHSRMQSVHIPAEFRPAQPAANFSPSTVEELLHQCIPTHCTEQHINRNERWWHSIVVRTLILAGELSLSCARLMDGRLTTLWVKHLLSVNQQGQLSLPSLRGRLNE